MPSEFAALPETCPECDAHLDEHGECPECGWSE